MAAGRVIVAIAVCLLLWALLDAGSLKRSAEASPLGIRRTAALAILRPLSRVSSMLGIDRVGHLVERALGQNPDAQPGGPGLGFGGVDQSRGGDAPPVVAPPPRAAGGSAQGNPARTPSSSPAPPATGSAASLPPLRRPTAANPLRVLVVGDSLGQDLGAAMERALDAKRFAVTVDGRFSTGLSRVDYFNWPVELARDMARYRPEVVMALFGANDNQSLALPGGGYVYVWDRPQWESAYAARVAQAMSEATAGGARLAWVGLPITRSSVIPPARARQLNAIYSAQATRVQGAVYFDSWHLFVNGRGQYSAFLPDDHGHIELMRQQDRVHLSPPGNDYLTRELLRTLGTAWGLRT